jgi:predicted nucleotidyltransferase
MANEVENKQRSSVSGEMLREIVKRILTVSQPDRIILFGSAATGRMTRDSDIDLLVLERDPRDLWEEFSRIREALTGLRFAFDVIVISYEARSRDWPISLRMPTR